MLVRYHAALKPPPYTSRSQKALSYHFQLRFGTEFDSLAAKPVFATFARTRKRLHSESSQNPQQLSAMAASQINSRPKPIACETCEKMAWDNGRWSQWIEAPGPDSGPNGRTYHVCDDCLSSPRNYWQDLFSLCRKAAVGVVHLPRGMQSTASELPEMCVASQHHPETSGLKHYQKLEDPYEHSPLDQNQIRVLSLLPGGDDLFCTIENTIPDSLGAQYEALSYCWGDMKQPKRAIWINGRPFEVLLNLYDALTRLRRPTSTRKLWIDAICIDQVGEKGIAEKNIQIPLMGKIYHQASSVIVWLGSVEGDSDEVLDIISQQNVEAMRTRKFAIGFGSLLRRPWFRRTWIIQEFVLGKTLPQILCGSRAVSYSKFLATHWVLPELLNDSPEMEYVRTVNDVDSNGNLIRSRTVKKKLSAVWDNHREAEKTLANLITVRRQVLDDGGRVRHRPLYKILPQCKTFDATDLRDKIYGVFGVARPYVHHYIPVNYGKSIAEVYRDAMIYMLREEKEEPGVIDMYLEYPLSLSLNIPIPGMSSWVPDFSRNSPFLRNHEDTTWHWLYHQNQGPGGHTSLLRKQHGRHTVTRGVVDRELISIADTALTVRGFLVDEVDIVKESTFFALNDGIREYSERQVKSSSAASQAEGREIQSSLDRHDKISDHTSLEITTRPDDPPSLTFLELRHRTNILYEIDELCRRKLLSAGRALDSESWLTFVWRDLLEGYSTLVNMSEEEFDKQFYNLAGSEKPITGETRYSNILRGEARLGELPQLNIPMRELFKPPRSFFTTAMSGFYGISPPGVQEGDKLVFLFPQVYMAFILRPSANNYQMVCPCIVPPRLRDRALENLHSLAYEGDKFTII
jgi:hypothetical protein